MSSILEALRELEGSRAPATQAADEWEDRPRNLRRIVGTLAVVAVVGAGGAAFYLLRSAGNPVPTVPEASPATAPALPPAAPAAAPADAVLDADPPRARVAVAAPAAGAPERPVTRAAARPRPRFDDPATGPPRPAGEPRVAVTSIAYTSHVEDRAVVLSVDGGRPLTLHEGESADGIQVQLIRPDGVYVRHAGQIFAVPVRN